MKEIGDALGVNESRVSQIHKTALKKMATALQGEGIESAAAFCGGTPRKAVRSERPAPSACPCRAYVAG